MNLISPSEFSKVIKLSRQAISKAIAGGLLPFVKKGMRKYIDLDDPDVQAYIEDNSRQRMNSKKSDVDKLKKIIHPSEHKLVDKLVDKFPNIGNGLLEAAEKIQKEKTSKKKGKFPAKKSVKSNKKKKLPAKKSTKKKTTAKKSAKKSTKKPSKKKKSEKIPDEFKDLTSHEIRKRRDIAEMQKKQIQVEILKKNYLPREFIEDGLFRYIERLNSNLERSSAIFIKEVGQKILDDKEVTTKHIDKFSSLVLGLIDTTKKNIIKAIKKHEPSL